MNDLISIIVPIYRVEKYLDQCVESILNQTYKNIEIILVDDGSDDACPQMCDKYANIDSRIKVIHKKNEGADGARKTGILAAQGKYIGYVDGDDWVEPQMFERLYKFAVDYKVDVVESGVIDSCRDVHTSRVSYFEEGCYTGEKFSKIIAPKILYTGVFFQHGISPYLMTKLFLREKILKFQLMPEPSGNIVDDVMCVFPCVVATRSLYITHECYYHYRVRENSAKRLIRNDIASVVHNCYQNWITRFEGAEISDGIEQQIQNFAMYLLIAKAAYVFDDLKSEYYLKPFGNIKKKDRIVLYGAGTVGIHLQHYIKSVMDSNLIFWADRNFAQLDSFSEVGDPKKITELDYDYVIISILSAKAAESAKQDIIKSGVPERKIRWIAPEYITNPKMLLDMAAFNGENII